MAEVDNDLLEELRNFANEEDEEETDDGAEEQDDTSELDALRAEIEALRGDAQATRNFRANPTQGLNELANQLGYKLTPNTPNQPSSAPSSQYGAAVKSAVEEAFQDAQDLGFLKPQFEVALSKALEGVVKPLEDMTAREKAAARASLVRSVETEMDREFPGWRQHNDEMQELGNWLRSALNGGDIYHPKYGSLYKMAYALIAGEGRATAAAAKRLSGASRNRTRTGGTGTTKPDVSKKIKETKNRDDQVSIALDAALAELGL
jgi:hypothetical protein